VPIELPSTVNTATARPHATPRASVNNTLGPGTMMMVIDAMKNSASWLPEITPVPPLQVRSNTFKLAPILKPIVAAKKAVATPGLPPRSQPIVNTDRLDTEAYVDDADVQSLVQSRHETVARTRSEVARQIERTADPDRYTAPST
jgi:hypothetical protein